jgi:hypothetical protein
MQLSDKDFKVVALLVPIRMDTFEINGNKISTMRRYKKNQMDISELKMYISSM